MQRRNFFKVVLILVSITCILGGCSKSNVNTVGLFTNPTPIPTIIVEYVEPPIPSETPQETPNVTVNPVPDITETPVPSNQPIVIDTRTQTIKEDESYGYYYDQLTREQKVIYCSIFSYYKEIKKEYVEFIGVQPEDVERAKEAMDCDQFFLGVYNYTYIENDNSISVRVKSFTKNLSEGQKETIEKKAKKIVNGIKGETEEEVIRGIYDWCTKNIKYDETLSKKHIRDVYGALINKECVCVGYAQAFKYLCNKAEIECICVDGKGHTWNYVQLDGQWYAVDATWGEAGTNQYLLEGKEFMENKDHISENDFTLPTLADESAYPTDDEVQQIVNNLQDDIVAIATERLEGLEEEDEYDEGEYQLLYSINQKAKEILAQINKSVFHYYIKTSAFSTDYNELQTLIKVVNEI